MKLLLVIGVFALGGTTVACIGEDGCEGDCEVEECTNSSPPPPPAPPLVPATLAELSNGINAVISVDRTAGVVLALNVGSDVGLNPQQCPQLSAVATLNGNVMLASDQIPILTAGCGFNSYQCTMPAFTLPPTFDATSATLKFSITDSSGAFEIDLSLPEVSLDGPNVLVPQKIVSATLSSGLVPTQVVIGAPERGVVFFKMSLDVTTKAGGFSFIMPTIDLTVSSEGAVDRAWDAGPSSCGQGGATLPCNAALEVIFDPLFDRCDFGTCNVETAASGAVSGATSGAASGTVFLPVVLATAADDAGASDASTNGD